MITQILSLQPNEYMYTGPKPEAWKKWMSERCLGRNNPNWKETLTSYKYIHEYLTEHWPGGKPDSCSTCGLRVKVELTNIRDSPNPETYTRDVCNWKWQCRACHMKEDKRIKRRVMNIKRGSEAPGYGKCGQLNPFFGKHHTEETRRKMREAWIKRRMR